MSRIKMIAGGFDERTGISIVTIRTPYGDFTGYARVHPEDELYASKYTGCRYAEMRAKIKYLKAKKANYQIRLKTMIDFQKDCHIKQGFQNFVYIALFDKLSNYYTEKTIKIYRNQILKIKIQIQKMEKDLKDSIRIQDGINKAMIKKTPAQLDK